MANEVKISNIQVKRAYNLSNINQNTGFQFGEPVYVCDKNTLYIGTGTANPFSGMKHIAEDLCVCDGTNQIFHLMGANTNKVGSLRIGGFCATCEGLESISGKTKLVFGTGFEGISLEENSGQNPKTLSIGTSGFRWSGEQGIVPLYGAFSAIRNGADFINNNMKVGTTDEQATTTIGCDGIKTEDNNEQITQFAKWDKVRSIYYGTCDPVQYFAAHQLTANEGDIYICL